MDWTLFLLAAFSFFLGLGIAWFGSRWFGWIGWAMTLVLGVLIIGMSAALPDWLASWVTTLQVIGWPYLGGVIVSFFVKR
jgi:hypothetical protein